MLQLEILENLNILQSNNDRINNIANIKRNFAQTTYNWLRHNPDFNYCIQEAFLDKIQTNTSTTTCQILNGKISSGIWNSINFTFPVNVQEFKFVIYQGMGVTLYINSTEYEIDDIDKTLTLPTATNTINIQINSTQENYMFFMLAAKEA